MPTSNLRMENYQKERVQEGGNELCSCYEETKRER
jgi:hypothetical protein